MSEQRDLDLNEWLHERLFGLHPVCRDVDCLGGQHWHGSRGATYRITITPYSSTGKGMLAVLAALRERGVSGAVLLPWEDRRGYVVQFHSVPLGIWMVSREADTLPEAVALAARAALEAENR